MGAADFKVTTLPSPVGGLNVYDSLAAMTPTDAIVLNNIIPQPYGCIVRRGSKQHATELGIQAESLVPYEAADGESKLFAFAGDSMYDITIAGPAGAALVASLANALWFDVQFTNTAGDFSVMVNGADDPIVYGPAGILRLTAGNGTDPNTIDGVDPANFIHVTSHQRRLWFVERDSTRGWYLPTEAYYGTVSMFDFGPIFKRGGHLVALTTWTVDSGEGSTDQLVAFSSEGEVVVYQGIDPDDAPTNWKLVGLWFAGSPPTGRRFFDKVGGDILFLTQVGVVSMATMVTSTQVNVTTDKTWSQKVQFLLMDLLADLQGLAAWQLIYTPSNNFVMINIPSVFEGGNGQLAANQINKSWFTISGWDAVCWVNWGERVYFSDREGTVWLAWEGNLDYVDLDGAGGINIDWRAHQAYSYLEAPAVQKQVGMYRLNFLVGTRVAISTEILYDFAQTSLPYPTPLVGYDASLWGLSLWGTGIWGGGIKTQRDWEQAKGIGVAASIRVAGTSILETTWVSTDLTYRVGGPL